MKNTYELRWVWLLVMAATVGLILQQSTLPPQQSAEASDAVTKIVVPIVGGPETTLGGFFERFMRKIAHFVEFFILGAEAGCYLFRRVRAVTLSLLSLFGLAVASADELLQRFTGRGPAVTDVLLDLAGYLAGLGLFLGLLTLAAWLYNKRKEGAPPRAETNDA
ncbi:MAG: VanZ family protein [Clostridia bacterium]|nr:VanZ family protein [Clostridia bacterium]